LSGHQLGIDVGGTACRWVLCDAGGKEIARGAASGATGHVFNPAERERLQNALTAVAAEVRAVTPDLGGVAAGITGFGSVVEAEIKQMLTETFAVAPADLTVIDDIMLAYAAVFAPGEGHLVSAGTGSIGLHLGPETGYVRVGGRGILIDDAGSGSWIALRALDETFRSLDRNGDFRELQSLADELFAITGGSDWHAVRHFVYAGDRGRIGTLATGVAKAALAGDRMALGILDAAGRELAALAKALVGRTAAKPVRFIGGVLKLHPVVTTAIREELAGLDVGFPTADAALAAARMHLPQNAGWRTTFDALHSRPGAHQ
jgi:N-acetylglucosamine kinase-like BadF-type ATPase